MGIEIIVEGTEAEREAIASCIIGVEDVTVGMISFRDAEEPSIGLAGGDKSDRKELGEQLVEAVNNSSFLDGTLK